MLRVVDGLFSDVLGHDISINLEAHKTDILRLRISQLINQDWYEQGQNGLRQYLQDLKVAREILRHDEQRIQKLICSLKAIGITDVKHGRECLDHWSRQQP
jgi:hypothetical protein